MMNRFHQQLLAASGNNEKQLLQDLFPDNAEFEYDFRNADSYASGTTVNSLVDTPASGADKTTNYLLSNSAAASLFTGSAGTPAAKMVMDGTANNVFYIASNSAFVEAMHKTTGGRDFTLYALFKIVDGAGGKAVIDTQQTSGQRGIACNWSIDNTYRLQQHGDTDEAEVDSVETYSDGKVALVVWARDQSAGKTYIYVNGVLSFVDHTFNTTTTNSSSSSLHFFGHPASAFLPSGSEVYEVGCLSDIAITPEQERRLRVNCQKSGDGRLYTDAGTLRSISFTDQSDLETETLTTSDAVLIGGFTGSKSISVTGGEYKIIDLDGTTVIQDWGSSEGTITQGRYVQVRGTTSDTAATPVNVALSIGGETADTFTITTASESSGSMADIIPSTVFDLSASNTDSYSGSGTTWASLTEDTEYDFDNNGFVFTGTAGSQAACWTAQSGGSQFDLVSGVNTAFLNNLPKTTGGTDFGFSMAVKTPTTPGIMRYFHGGPVNNQPLLGLLTLADNELVLFQRGDGGSSNGASGIELDDDTEQIIIVTHNSATNETTFGISTTAGFTTATVSHTYNATTTNAPLFTLCAQSDGGNPLLEGSLVREVAMYNTVLDTDDMVDIITEYASRTGIAYVSE